MELRLNGNYMLYLGLSRQGRQLLIGLIALAFLGVPRIIAYTIFAWSFMKWYGVICALKKEKSSNHTVLRTFMEKYENIKLGP